MKRRLSKKQLEVMKILWSASSPMIASDIVEKGETLQINTVQACLRGLIKKEYIEIADIVYSGTVLTRSYKTVISKEDYFNDTYEDIMGASSPSVIMASLIDSEENLDNLEQLEQLIQKKKKEVKER